VRPNLNDPPIHQHPHAIRPAHGAEPVRDHHGGSVLTRGCKEKHGVSLIANMEIKRNLPSRARDTARSDLASNALVASSSSNTAGSASNTLAMAMR
jgi:hypothetical protein